MIGCFLTRAVGGNGLLGSMTAAIRRVMHGTGIQQEENIRLRILKKAAHAAPLEPTSIFSWIAKKRIRQEPVVQYKVVKEKESRITGKSGEAT